MIAEELINQMIPPLKSTDTAQKAINWMEEFRVTQLPVTEDGDYKGLLNEDVILESGDLNKIITDLRLDFSDVFVYRDTHFYDVVKLALKNKMQLVAVLSNEDKKFTGVISVNETTSAIAQMFATQGPGGILVLSMKETDYSLAQISRLIESNDTRILSTIVANDELDPSLIKLTLKLNKTDLSRIVATLERYDYKIIAQFHESEMLSSDKERLDLLFRYLNI